MSSSMLSPIVVYHVVILLTCLIFVKTNVAITLKLDGYRGIPELAITWNQLKYGTDFTASFTSKSTGKSIKIVGPTTDGQVTITLPETVSDSDKIFVTIAGVSPNVQHTERGERPRQNNPGYLVGRRANFVIPAKKLQDISRNDSAKSVTATVHVDSGFYNKVTMTMRENGGPVETLDEVATSDMPMPS